MNMRSLCALGLAALVAACANAPSRSKLDETLYAYAGAIRWGDLGSVEVFLDPERRAELAPKPIERERMAQLQVTGYHVQSKEQSSETELRQVVQITLVNRHTLVERSVIDRQVWRWDEEAKAWWLTSGLPDFAPGR